MKEKKAYIALIFDFKRIPNYHEENQEKSDVTENTSIKNKKKFMYFSKSYTNKRWALYCSCEYRTEYPEDHISRDFNFEIKFKSPLVCEGCNKKYNSFLEDELMMIYSRNPVSNVVSRRFSVVENNNSYALYSFATSVFVSATTHKLIFKNYTCKTLYISKNSDTIRIKNGEKIITVPLKKLVKKCSNVLNDMIYNVHVENIIPQGLFERQIVSPIIKFCEIIESKCDKRDVERIKRILDSELNDAYFKFMFKQKETSYGYWASTISEMDCFYNYDLFNKCSDNGLPSRYLWMQYLKRRMCIMLAISIYPPISTLVFAYGINKVLNLLDSSSSLMCDLTNLKRKNPTNPKDILEVMFKSRVTNEIAKNKRLTDYIKNEERKRKRKLKKNPEDVKLKIEINSHPTQWLDLRIPNEHKYKKVVKKINFRKFYVDLFLEDEFDKIAEIFYGFINNESAFDEIETVDKIILNYDVKKSYEIITTITESYFIFGKRIDFFKLTYKHIIQILKLDNGNDKLENLLLFYFDSIMMMNSMNIPIDEIFKIKNADSLNEMHNSLNESYKISLNKEMSKKLKEHVERFRYTEGVYDNIEFKLLDTPELFYEESSVMNHCVKTYCTSVSNGLYIIYSIKDLESGNRATLSLNTKEGSFTFNQLKSKNNSKATVKIINCVKEFISDFFNITEIDKCYDLILDNKVDNYNQNLPIEEIVLQQLQENNEARIINDYLMLERNINNEDLPF